MSQLVMSELRPPRALRLRSVAGRVGVTVGIGAIVAFLLAPIVIVVVTSFSSGALLSFPPPGFSTRWYVAFFSNPDFVNSLFLSLKLAAIAAGASTVVGLLAALALELGAVRGARFFRGIYIAPLAVPAVVLGIGLLIYFSRLGIDGTLLALSLAHTLIVLPFTVIILSSGLRAFDRSLIEAARILGAGWPRVIVTVVLPVIRGSLLAAFIFAFLASMDEVVVTLLLAGPTTTTLPVRIFNYVEYTADPTPAAIATVLIAGTIGAFAILNRAIRFGRLF